MISICMVKIFGESILKPLELIFKSGIESGKFPIKWKKASIFQFIKSNKELKGSYSLTFLLLISGKILGRLIYNKMFSSITNHFLLISQASNQKTPTSINCYVLLIIFINLSTTISRQELSLLGYQKHLIKFGMRVYSINWQKMVYQKIYLILSQIF